MTSCGRGGDLATCVDVYLHLTLELEKKKMMTHVDDDCGPCLRHGEAALVHAVVDAVVHPLVHLVDGAAQVQRVQVQLRLPASGSLRTNTRTDIGA